MAIFEGSNFDDQRSGDFTLMDGGHGNDIINSTLPGEVLLLGGLGNDFVFIDYVNDPDTVGEIYGGPGDDVVSGGALNDRLHGKSGNDFIIAHGRGAHLSGAGGQDALVGGDGAGHLDLDGGAGNDKGTITVYDQNRAPFTVEAGLFGSTTNDRLAGGSGDDLLVGGLGQDHLFGGSGQDIFRFVETADSLPGSSNRDTIKDFSRSEHDRIDLSQIDADQGIPGQQAFDFIGKAAFHHVADELRFKHGLVQGDTDGDGRANFEIKVQFNGHGPLRAQDFLLAASNQLAPPSIGDHSATNGDDELIGGNGDDVFHGRGGKDFILGRGGDDYLAGQAGDDHLVGGAGKDTLRGGAGNDIVEPGKGADVLSGGRGHDTFAFFANDGHDTITDFKRGQDHFDFREAALAFSDIKITYHAHDAIIKAAGTRIELSHFDGHLHESDFVL